MKIIKLFSLPLFGKYIMMYVTKKQGGDKKSKALREYYRTKKNVNVEMYSYGGCFDRNFNVGGKVNIGRYCSLGQNIRYFGGNHPIDYASTTPYFYNKNWCGFDVEDIKRETLNIANDVWIGYGTLITSKCKKIGNGAIIGAGSVVTKDVEPYSIVVGSPAKVIKYRFKKDTIELLEKSKWWELTPEELIKFYNFVKEPDEFAKKIIEYRKDG